MNILDCIAVVLINKTDHPWNDFDILSIERAKVGCMKRYKKCLKEFTKTGERDYYALCGNPEETKPGEEAK